MSNIWLKILHGLDLSGNVIKNAMLENSRVNGVKIVESNGVLTFEDEEGKPLSLSLNQGTASVYPIVLGDGESTVFNVEHEFNTLLFLHKCYIDNKERFPHITLISQSEFKVEFVKAPDVEGALLLIIK